MGAAFGWGALAASSLLIGAIVALLFRIGLRALVGGAREIQRPRDREEVPYLMHFHDRDAPISPDGSLPDQHPQ